MYRDALSVVENMQALLREKRRLDKTSFREISDATGIPESTLCAFERDPAYGMGYPRVCTLLRWMAEQYE